MEEQKKVDQTEPPMPKYPSVEFMLGRPMSADAHRDYVDNMVATAKRILVDELRLQQAVTYLLRSELS